MLGRWVFPCHRQAWDFLFGISMLQTTTFLALLHRSHLKKMSTSNYLQIADRCYLSVWDA